MFEIKPGIIVEAIEVMQANGLVDDFAMEIDETLGVITLSGARYMDGDHVTLFVDTENDEIRVIRTVADAGGEHFRDEKTFDLIEFDELGKYLGKDFEELV